MKTVYILGLALFVAWYVFLIASLLKEKDEKDKRIAWMLIGIAVGFFLLFSAVKDDYGEGVAEGYENGYHAGFKEGYETGAEDGYADGYADGYSDGESFGPET